MVLCVRLLLLRLLLLSAAAADPGLSANNTAPAPRQRPAFGADPVLDQNILISRLQSSRATAAAAARNSSSAADDLLQLVDVRSAAAKLASQLAALASRELGMELLQRPPSGEPTTEDPAPGWSGGSEAAAGPARIQAVKRLASRVQAKLHRHGGALFRTRHLVEELFWQHLHRPLTAVTPCCTLHQSQLTYNSQFGCPVNVNASCDIAPSLMEPFAFNPGRNLTQAFSANLRAHPAILWQYYISKDGVHAEFPAHRFGGGAGGHCAGYDASRHLPQYLAAVLPDPKHVVVVMDVGGAPSAHRLRVTRAAAAALLAPLSAADRVSVLAVSDLVQRPATESCPPHGLFTATDEAKSYLSQFIAGARWSPQPTNHTLALRAGLQLLSRAPTLRRPGPHALLVYISHGELSSVVEPQRALAALAHYQATINATVVLGAFGVGVHNRLSKDFLERLTTQDFDGSAHNVSLGKRLVAGRLFLVNSTDQLPFQVAGMLSVLPRTTAGRPAFSPARWDPVSRQLVVSVTQPCYHVDYFIGALGMDLRLADLVEDVTYFSGGGRRYAFVVDAEGRVLQHELMPRPLLRRGSPPAVDISALERRPGFDRLRMRLLGSSSGASTLQYSHWDGRANTTERFLYTWQRVQDFPYTVCIVHNLGASDDAGAVSDAAVSTPAGLPPNIVYHSMDVAGWTAAPLCRQFGHVATLAAASLYLSPAAFLSPFEQLSAAPPSARQQQAYMAYLSDSTRLITNPGLRPGVRSGALLLGRLVSQWRARAVTGYWRGVVRRFAATPTGVLLMHPGQPLDGRLDPTRQGWYQTAIELPGKLVLSPPHLDPGGAGYVVTLSQAVVGPDGALLAVVGADLTVGAVGRLVKTAVGASCSESDVACLLLEHAGYLVWHPAQARAWPSQQGPVEERHVSSQEPLLANHLLTHQQFVQKLQCTRYWDGTIQRYYRLNSSSEPVAASREPCLQYRVAPVAGTAVFVGVLRRRCHNPAFCACGRADRACLDCSHMEADQCECPCECRLRADLCTDQLMDAHAACAPPAENGYGPRPASHALLARLAECLPVDCGSRASSEACSAAPGCQWCRLAADGHNPLPRPHCAHMDLCWAGVRGAHSPYGASATQAVGARLRPSASPVGPAAGGAIAAFVVLAAAVLCYRHRASTGGRSPPPMPLTADDEDDELCELRPAAAAPPPPPPPPALAPLVRPAAVSPYRLNVAYRRPAASTAGESDPGYSTMTPHDDSEAPPPELVPAQQRPEPPQQLQRPAAPPEVTQIAPQQAAAVAPSPGLVL